MLGRVEPLPTLGDWMAEDGRCYILLDSRHMPQVDPIYGDAVDRYPTLAAYRVIQLTTTPTMDYDQPFAYEVDGVWWLGWRNER